MAKKRNAKWLNWEGEILIDEIDNGKLKGRNKYYKSIFVRNSENIVANMKEKVSKIDNKDKLQDKDICYIDSNNYYQNSSIGKTLKVKVIGYSDHTLEAIQIK